MSSSFMPLSHSSSKRLGVAMSASGTSRSRIAVGNRFGNVEIAGIAHDRIADIDRSGVFGLHRLDQRGDRLGLAGIAEIAGEHARHLAEPAARARDPSSMRQTVPEAERCGSPAMSGMPGQDDRRHRPDRVAERLQREDRGAVADRTARDMARNDDDRARRLGCFRMPCQSPGAQQIEQQPADDSRSVRITPSVRPMRVPQYSAQSSWSDRRPRHGRGRVARSRPASGRRPFALARHALENAPRFGLSLSSCFRHAHEIPLARRT